MYSKEEQQEQLYFEKVKNFLNSEIIICIIFPNIMQNKTITRYVGNIYKTPLISLGLRIIHIMAIPGNIAINILHN